MNEKNITVYSKNLYEFLPITQHSLSNWWFCDIDPMLDVVQIKRSFRWSVPLFLTLTTILVFIVGCVVFSLKFFVKTEIGDIWPLGPCIIFLAFIFAIVFRVGFLYGVSQDEKYWPECRFMCTDNGDITIHERIHYKNNEYSDIAVGVIGGHNTLGLYDIFGKQKKRSKSLFMLHGASYHGWQLYIYIKNEKGVWERYMITNEYMKRKTILAAKHISQYLRCSLHIQNHCYAECLDQQEVIDNNVIKSISEQPYLYVGVIDTSVRVPVQGVSSD